MRVLIDQTKSFGDDYSFVSKDGGMAFIKEFVIRLTNSPLNKDLQYVEIKGDELTRWDEPNADILVTKDGKLQKKDIDRLFDSENVDEPDTVSISVGFNGQRYNIELKTKWSSESNSSEAVKIRIRPNDKEIIKAILKDIGYSV